MLIVLRHDAGHELSVLEQRAQERTEALAPPHEYVPWVVVNGIPLRDDYASAARYVCAAYGGERCARCRLC